VIEAFLWGLLGAGSLLIGAFFAGHRALHPRPLGLLMGFGAGVLLSAVSFELLEEAFEVSGDSGGVFLGFFAGALVFYFGDLAISSAGYRNRKDVDGAPQDASGLAIVLGAALDGVPESAVLGLTLLQTGSIGVSMLVAVFVSNIPEAIAATASLRNGGWPMTRVYRLWTVIVLVSATAAGAGYLLLDDASAGVVAFTLAFAGGAILTMLSTSMMPEAYEHAGRPVGLVTTLGFAVAFGINLLSR
jgi:zinc transporter, ZIP family